MIICGLLLSLNMQAQSQGIRLINLETIEHGKYNRVQLQDEGRPVGYLIFTKMEDGSTAVSIDLSESECKGVKLEYMRGQEVYYTDKFNNGPLGEFNVEKLNYPIYVETIMDEDQDNWIHALLSAALCCIEVEVSGTTHVDIDGCETTLSSWSVVFDCDCLSGSENTITGPDGTQHANVDQIIISII